MDVDVDRLRAQREEREDRRHELVELLQAQAAGLVTDKEARAYTKQIRPEWFSE